MPITSPQRPNVAMMGGFDGEMIAVPPTPPQIQARQKAHRDALEVYASAIRCRVHRADNSEAVLQQLEEYLPAVLETLGYDRAKFDADERAYRGYLTAKTEAQKLNAVNAKIAEARENLRLAKIAKAKLDPVYKAEQELLALQEQQRACHLSEQNCNRMHDTIGHIIADDE